MIYQNYNLNLIPDQVPLSVWCSQYDKDSRTFQFTIYKGSELYTIPSGSTVSVRGTKQDNTGFEYSCAFDGTVVDVVVKDQMTIFAGKVPCEVRITNGSDIIGTANFNLMVERTPLDTDVTISETDLPLLEEAEQNAIRAENAADQAETVLASAVKSVNNVLPDANGNVDVNGALPSGGTQGQVLTKQSATYGDVAWEDIDALPSGGTQGQVLTKQSSTDGDADWEDIQALPSGGTTGQYLVKSSATEGDADWQTKEVELTQAEYDALPSSKLTDGVSYYITDGESAPSTNRFSASGISYDNTNSGLSATNVQSAIDELNNGTTFTPTLKSGFTLASWGYVQGFKMGSLCVVAVSGLKSNSALSSDTSALGIPYTVKSSGVVRFPVGTTGTRFAIANVIANTQSIAINEAPANENMFFTVVFAVNN